MIVAFDVGPVRRRQDGVGLYAAAMANALSEGLPHEQLRLIGRRPDADGLPASVTSRARTSGPYPVWVALRSAQDAREVGAGIVHYSDGIVPIVRQGRTVLAVHDLSTVRQWRTHSVPRWLRIPLVLVSPRLADLVLVPSRATADEVIALCHVPGSRIEIVPYAARGDIQPASDESIASVLPRYGLQRGGYILALGTIEPRKNHLRLIRAFERMAERGSLYSDLRLAVAGKPGWGSEPVVRAIADSPVANRITMLGYVPGADVAALISGAGAVAYISLYEGFGLPVVEALACGAPIVTSNVSSMPEVAGDAGFLVNPLDVEDIQRGLQEALDAKTADADAVSSAARAQASLFSWDKTARRVVELYDTRL